MRNDLDIGELMNTWQKTKMKVITLINKVRLNFRIEKTPKFYRIVIHEKAKPFFMWLKNIFTAISLFAAFYTFDNVFYAFLFGVLVWLVITFIEKTIFIYSSLFVMPQLTFEYDFERLLGVSFGVAIHKGESSEIPVVGFVVKDKEYARQMHETLLYWTGGKVRDEEGNICLSSIVLNSEEYIFLCYPNVERKSVTEFHKEVESKRKEESLTDTHLPMFTLTIIGKKCQISAGSYFPTFREKYKKGVPVLFKICMPDDKDGIKSIDGIDDFILFNLKIKGKEELTRKDIEFDYMRIMG